MGNDENRRKGGGAPTSLAWQKGDGTKRKRKKDAGALKPAKAIVEALLFAAGDEGLSLSQIAAVLEVSELEAKAVIEELQQDCRREERGIQLVELGGVFLLATKKNTPPI